MVRDPNHTMAALPLLCCALFLLLTAPGASAGWLSKWKQARDHKGGREVIPLSAPLIWESTAKGTIDMNGKPVHIKGINWNGMVSELWQV